MRASEGKVSADRARDVVITSGGTWFNCSDPPEESCSDAGCPVHGDGDDADWGDEDIDQ